MTQWDPEQIAKAKQHLEQRFQERRLGYSQLHAQAVRDFVAILEMIVRDFHPERVYQWGSVLRPELFRDYSDIDIVVEGITEPQAYFDLLGKAQALTDFPIDLVQLEKIEPEFAESIRKDGKLVYERQR
jgi:predicted nucleotidyltransferase